MRILHVSHDKLPDARVERSAWSARKRDYVVYFAGRGSEQEPPRASVFSESHTLPFSRSANLHLPYAWNNLKKHFQRVLAATRPDMAHAHNVIAARLAYESNVPFVFDDHEYYSLSSRLTEYGAYNPFVRFEKRITKSYASRLWSSWERQISSQAPVLTVSDTIANEYRQINKDVFVVPNMPSMMDMPDDLGLSEVSSKELSSVYVGRELSSVPRRERDTSGLLDLFSAGQHGRLVVIGDEKLKSTQHVESTGFLDRVSMMKELARHHVGLIPWKSFWLHKYSNPNKAYEYVNAGLVVLATADLVNVTEALGPHCIPIHTVEDLARELDSLKQRLSELGKNRGKIVAYARNNCIWEKYESRIFDAYACAT